MNVGQLYKISNVEINNGSYLSKRGKGLIESAVNYHMFLQPGRTLKFKVYMGEDWQYPCLTDLSTLNGGLTVHCGLDPFLTFDASSFVQVSSVSSPHYFSGTDYVIDNNERYILLTPDNATDEDVQSRIMPSKRQVLYRWLEENHPVALDSIRESRRKKRIAEGESNIEPFTDPNIKLVNSLSYTHHPFRDIVPGDVVNGGKRAVLIGMHWLQPGGAEKWALETVKIVRETGFIPIVVADRPSHEPWISKPEFDGALVFCLTFPAQERPGDEPLLRAIFEQFDIAGVLVHHCQWLYDRLWWIKRYRSNCQIIDSLHIIEHMYQGGYPCQAVSRDRYIDIHHVISPQLVKWLTGCHGVKACKVVDAPLIGLTADLGACAFKERTIGVAFTVCFVGRITRQKRPESFVLLAERAKREFGNDIKFIMHGSGDMDSMIDRMILKRGLSDILERRGMNVPVSDTYRDADLLIVSSINEGITLTSIESICAGVPVLSTDVGSQNTVIPSEALLARETKRFIEECIAKLRVLKNDESSRRRIWGEEKMQLENFAKLESANSYFERTIKGWYENEE